MGKKALSKVQPTLKTHLTTTQSSTSRIRVVLIDDHQIIRDSLDALLSQRPDFQVIGQADNGTDAVALCEESRPDLVIIDMDLPGMGGMEVIARVRSCGATPAFVVLSMFGDAEFAAKALAHGASAYVHKGSGLREVMKAIDAATSGGTYLCPHISALVEGVSSEGNSAAESHLTDREREVLQCLSMGMNAKQTARKLVISPATVHVHRSRIREKLGVQSQAEMVRAGQRLGLSGIESDHFD